MKSIRWAALLALVPIAVACGPSGAGGMGTVIEGANVFQARVSGGVAFVVLSESWAVASPSMSAKSSSPGPEEIGATWRTHDGTTVELTSKIDGVGDGTVTLDGVAHDLSKGTLFALRRANGVTEVVQVEEPAFTEAGFEEQVAEFLQTNAGIREFLGLDRPAPVAIHVMGKAGDPAAPVWQVEIQNTSDRPVSKVSFRVLARGAGGDPLPPSPMPVTLSLPEGEPLAGGATRKEELTRDPKAETATILVTRVYFASGEPARWAPAGN